MFMLKKYAYPIQVEKSLAAELYSSSALKSWDVGPHPNFLHTGELKFCR